MRIPMFAFTLQGEANSIPEGFPKLELDHHFGGEPTGT